MIYFKFERAMFFSVPIRFDRVDFTLLHLSVIHSLRVVFVFFICLFIFVTC